MDALDLSFLEEFERQKIFAVLQRDADLHKNDQERKKKLTEKATRTQNLTIQKKIKMRSGEWFTEMKKKRQTHKKSGTDIVRQSMRRARPYSKAPNQRHRAAPTPPGKQEPMETEPHYEQSQREVQPTATPPSTPLIHKQEYTNETTIMASSTPDLYTRADTSSSDNSTRKHESREKGKSLVKNSDDYYGENNKEDDLQTNSYHSKDNFPIPNTDTILSSRVSNTTLDNSLITTTPTLPVKKYSSENTNYDSDQTEASQSFWKSEYEQFSAQQQPLAINHHNIPDSNYQNYKREEYVDESTPEATPASVDLHSPTYNYPEHSEIIKKRSLESIDENSKLEELSSDVRENNNYKYSENKNNYADMSIDDDQPKVCDSSSNSDSSDSNMSHECSLVALKSAKKSPPLIEVTQASEQSLLEKIPEEEKIEGDDIRQKVTGVESSDSKDSQNDEIQNTFKSTEVKPHPRESTNWFKKHVGRKHGSYDLTPTGSEESSESSTDSYPFPMTMPENKQITPQYIENLNTTIDQNLLYDKLSYLANEDNKPLEAKETTSAPVLSDNEQYSLSEILQKLDDSHPPVAESNQNEDPTNIDKVVDVFMFDESGTLCHVSTTSSGSITTENSALKNDNVDANQLVEDIISEGLDIVAADSFILDEPVLVSNGNEKQKDDIALSDTTSQNVESDVSNIDFSLPINKEIDNIPIHDISYSSDNNDTVVSELKEVEPLTSEVVKSTESIELLLDESITEDVTQDTQPVESQSKDIAVKIAVAQIDAKTTDTEPQHTLESKEPDIEKGEEPVDEERGAEVTLKSSLRKSSLRCSSPVLIDQEVKHVHFTEEDTDVRVFVPESNSDDDLVSDSDEDNGQTSDPEIYKTGSWDLNKSIDSDSDSDDPSKYFHVYSLKPSIPEIVITYAESESESEKEFSEEDFELEIDDDFDLDGKGDLCGDDFDKQPMETPSDNDTTDVNLLEETLKYNDNEIDLQNIPKDDENIVSGDSIIRNDESESGSDSETGRPHKKFGSSRRKLRQHYDIEMTDGMSHVQPVTTEYQTTEQIDSCTPEESNSENFKDVSSVVSHHKELPGIALEEFENEYLADSVIESVEDKSAQDIAADLSYSDAGNNEINTEVKSENLKLENVDDATKQAVEEDKGVQSIDEIESENLKLENVDDAKQNVDDATKQAVEEDKRVQSIDDSQEKGKSRKIKRLGSSRRKKAAPLMSDPDECIDGQPPVDDESFAKTIATISESIEKADDENTELSVLLAFEKIEMENKIKSELSEDDVEVSDIFKKVDDDYNEIVEQSDEIKGNTAIEESENVDAYISQEQKAVENLDCTSTDQSKPDDNLIQTSKDSSQIGSQDIDESMELDNPPSEQEKHLADEDSEIMDLPKVVKKVRIVKKTSNREMERPESPMPEIPDDMDNWDSRKNREPRVVKIRRKGSSRRNPIPDFRSLGGDEESPAASGEELPKSPSKKVVRVVKKSAGDGQTKRKRVVVKKKREAEQ